MIHGESKELFEQGREFLKEGDAAEALAIFQELSKRVRDPLLYSCMAFCLAKEKGRFAEAISLCKEAVRLEPREPQHFLYLGRIHLLAHQKKDAIRIFRMGLRHGNSPEIIGELNRLGARRAPVLPFLPRTNPINKYLGIALTRLKMR
jgi:predicted Zn-dependent protease